jgi:Fe(3+) dicitrate transport protein
MNILKASLITPSIVLMLSANLFGQESYTIKTNTLQEALEIIAKKAKLPYIVEESLIKGKNSPSIKNIEGVQEALNAVLKNTNLKAIIKNDTIIIKKMINSKKNDTKLKDVLVMENLAANFKLESDFISNITDKDLKKFGGSRNIVNIDTSKQRGDTSISEVMRRIPGVISTKQNGTGGSPSSLNIGVRGQSQRLSPGSTILVDGIPLAVAPYGQPQLSLAPVSFNMLSDIDVIRGGGSVRFGPQNVGGVINFITKDIPKTPQGEVSIAGTYYNKGDSGIQNKSISLYTGSMINDKFGVALFYEGIKGSTWRDHSKNNIDSLVLKTKYLIDDNNLLSAKVSYYQAKNELPGGLTRSEYEDDPYQSRRSFDNFDGDRKEIVLDYKSVLSSDLLLNIKSFYNVSKREFSFSRGAPDISTRFDTLPRDYDVFGLESIISKKFKVNSYPTELTVGYRYIYETANEKRFRKSTIDGVEVNNRNSHNNTYANSYYTDWRWNIDNLILTPGIRYEEVRITRENNLNDFSEEVNYNEALPSINANYQINKDWNIFANYNRSFGSVQHLQLNLNEASTPTDLDAEVADIYEVGARFYGSHSNFDITLFRVDFKNRLGFNGDIGAWENNGHVVNDGVEFSGRYFLDELGPIFEGNSIYGNFTYIDAGYKDEFSGNRVEFTSERTGLIGYEVAKDTWSTYIEVYAQSDQFSDRENTREENEAADEGIIGGYALVNIGYNKKLHINDKNVSLSAGIKNLFNKETFSRSTDTLGNGKYIGEPRSINFSMNIKF